MSLVGVISDTHGTLPDAIFEAFAGVDHIIHAGDVGGDDIIVMLESMVSLTAVRGNTDHTGQASTLPMRATLDVAGVRFVIQHHPFPRMFDVRAAGVDVLVSGHTHRPVIGRRGSALVLDPGSATRPRSGPDRTVALVEIVEGSARARILEIG